MNWFGRLLASSGLAALAGLSTITAQAQTQAYPTRSITMIVPFAAGGPTDVVARIVTAPMAQTLGQGIIIENVVGAGGTTATSRAARATNDGYTLITGHMGTHAAAVPLYPNLAYHPEKDFEPVALLAGTPILILARKDFPPKDLKEFVTYVKANVDKVNAANAGTIKAYAVATPERNPSLPNVPTTTEAGLPAFQAQTWNAIFAPKGTSP